MSKKDPELVRWSTAQTMVALAARYAAPEFAFLPQVRNATGAGHSRTADAVAMGLWPSRGLFLHGFEVKVSRGDWVRELRDPAKADRIANFCDRWWIVAGATEIVQDGELPATWGLLVPRGGKLVMQVEAPALEAKPVDRQFLAAILRKAQEVIVPRDQIAEEVHRARNEGFERGRKQWEGQAQTWKDVHERLAKTIREFEAAAGVSLSGFRHRAAEIGAAVRFVLDGGIEKSESRLLGLRAQAESILEEIDRQLAVPRVPRVMEGQENGDANTDRQ